MNITKDSLLEAFRVAKERCPVFVPSQGCYGDVEYDAETGAPTKVCGCALTALYIASHPDFRPPAFEDDLGFIVQGWVDETYTFKSRLDAEAVDAIVDGFDSAGTERVILSADNAAALAAYEAAMELKARGEL